MKLTKAQANLAEWALSVMKDIAVGNPEECLADLGYREAAVPTMKGTTLEMGYGSTQEVRMMLEDLEYRLLVQLPAMSEQETTGAGVAATSRCAKTTYELIYAAYKEDLKPRFGMQVMYTGPTIDMGDLSKRFSND